MNTEIYKKTPGIPWLPARPHVFIDSCIRCIIRKKIKMKKRKKKFAPRVIWIPSLFGFIVFPSIRPTLSRLLKRVIEVLFKITPSFIDARCHRHHDRGYPCMFRVLAPQTSSWPQVGGWFILPLFTRMLNIKSLQQLMIGSKHQNSSLRHHYNYTNSLFNKLI